MILFCWKLHKNKTKTPKCMIFWGWTPTRKTAETRKKRREGKGEKKNDYDGT